MSDTPRAIAEDIVVTYGGSVGLMDAIIDAIMAERERCAKIADDAVSGRAWQMSDANAHNDRRAARDFESMKFEAIEIAAAIRLSPMKEAAE